MKVQVTARHAKFTPSLKRIAAEKANHLEHFFDHLKKIEVILDVDGDTGFSAEMIASGLHDHIIVSRHSDRTALGALDAVVGKMERQLMKFKEKLKRKGDHESVRSGVRKQAPAKEGSAKEGSADVWW